MPSHKSEKYASGKHSQKRSGNSTGYGSSTAHPASKYVVWQGHPKEDNPYNLQNLTTVTLYSDGTLDECVDGETRAFSRTQPSDVVLNDRTLFQAWAEGLNLKPGLGYEW